MPRSNWKGTISFGLVSIPILLLNSEKTSEKVSFHQIDTRNNARIKYQRMNAETGKEVPWDKIGKAYQYDKETIIPVGEGELEKVSGENARTIAIEDFIKQDDIKFIDIDKTYYLLPDKKGEKGYVILREALKKSKKVGIAKVIISTKEYVAAVGCYENALVLYLLRYHDEIKPLSDYAFPTEDLKKYKVSTKEITIANQLITSMTTKWKPEKYKDDFQEAVLKWAENKVKHVAIKTMPKRGLASKSGKNVDFLDLLRKSLGKAKPSKSVKRKPTAITHARKKSVTKRANLH